MSAVHQLKIRPVTIADANRMQHYWNEPSTPTLKCEYSCTWGSDCETKHEGSLGVKEYDWYGNYKEINVKKEINNPHEGTYKTGYERQKDQSRKDVSRKERD